jgi:hypothetical protein
MGLPPNHPKIIYFITSVYGFENVVRPSLGQILPAGCLNPHRERMACVLAGRRLISANDMESSWRPSGFRVHLK